ncbi:MAG: DUF4340 domain-containing protein [Acidobacteriota bacterium]
MNRTHTILGVLLAAQLLLIAALNFSSLTGAAAVDAPHELLPVLDSITPEKVAIADGENHSVVLARKDDGWVLPEAGDYPVAASKVSDLLDKLKDIDVRRPVVTSSRYHSALKVTDDDFERRVQVWKDPSADPDVDLLVGTSPNYRITHVRSTDTDDVFEAMGFSTSELISDAGSWVDKKFVDVPFDEITAVDVENASGAFSLARTNGVWSIASPASASGKELDASKVDTFVRGLASMWLIDPIGKIDGSAQGLDHPVAQVALVRTPKAPESADVASTPAEQDQTQPVETPAEEKEAVPEPEVIKYRIGAEKDADSGQRYVARDGFEFAVTVSKYDAGKVVDKKLDDLLKTDEPKPAAEG